MNLFKLSGCLLLPVASLLSGSVLAKSKAAKYALFDIKPELNLTHNPLSLDLLPSPGKELFVMGVKDKLRYFAVYHKPASEDEFKLYGEYPLDSSIMAYDVFESDTSNDSQVYFMSAKGIHNLNLQDKKQPLPVLIKADSIYLQKLASHIVEREFTRDFNQDGTADFYLHDFKQLNIWTSGKDSLQHHAINLDPQFEMFSQSIEVKQRELFFADFSGDGLDDVAWLINGGVRYQPQVNSGFSTQAQTIQLNPEFSDTNWWDIRQADGSQLDQSNLHHRKIDKVEDINGDDLPDLLVRYAQSSGVFDRTNDYEVYFGQKQKGQLQYSAEPNTAIRSEGTLTGLKVVDLDQNKRKEILLSGFDIGVSQIISALLSGSVDQDVYVYQQDEQGKFGLSPSISKEVEMSFSLSSGKAGSPVVKLADLNGDQNQDLLISNGDSSLSLFKGQIGKKPFVRKRTKIKTQVPQDGELATTADIDQDGSHEIILRYGKEDGDLNNTIRVIKLAPAV